MQLQKDLRKKVASGIIDELKKVEWPTRKETMRLTGIVLVISLAVSLYIGIIDVLLTKGLEVATNLK